MERKLQTRLLLGIIKFMEEILDWEIEDPEKLREEEFVTECRKLKTGSGRCPE